MAEQSVNVTGEKSVSAELEGTLARGFQAALHEIRRATTLATQFHLLSRLRGTTMVFVTMSAPPDETTMNPTMTILASTGSAHASMGGLVLLDQ